MAHGRYPIGPDCWTITRSAKGGRTAACHEFDQQSWSTFVRPRHTVQRTPTCHCLPHVQANVQMLTDLRAQNVSQSRSHCRVILCDGRRVARRLAGKHLRERGPSRPWPIPQWKSLVSASAGNRRGWDPHGRRCPAGDCDRSFWASRLLSRVLMHTIAIFTNVTLIIRRCIGLPHRLAKTRTSG